MFDFVCRDCIKNKNGKVMSYLVTTYNDPRHEIEYSVAEFKDMIKNHKVDNAKIINGKVEHVLSFHYRGMKFLNSLNGVDGIYCYYKQERDTDTYLLKFYNNMNEDITNIMAFLLDRKVRKTGHLSVTCGGISPVDVIMTDIHIRLKEMGLISSRIPVEILRSPVSNAKVRYMD